jgi:hypothetical protein
MGQRQTLSPQPPEIAHPAADAAPLRQLSVLTRPLASACAPSPPEGPQGCFITSGCSAGWSSRILANAFAFFSLGDCTGVAWREGVRGGREHARRHPPNAGSCRHRIPVAPRRHRRSPGSAPPPGFRQDATHSCSSAAAGAQPAAGRRSQNAPLALAARQPKRGCRATEHGDTGPMVDTRDR